MLFAAPVAAEVLSATSPTIRNNLCVGGPCVDNDTFNADFHQLTLKNSNTRIEFRDSSDPNGNFPFVDWALQANERFNGSNNQFMLQNLDAQTTPITVRFDTGNHALYLVSGGNVGMGTDNPQEELEIWSTNSPTIRVQQISSGGILHYAWDIGGNETNFFVRDGNNGNLPFKIQPGADTNSLVIAGNNNVGLGTTSPATPLHILRNDGTAQLLIEDTGGANGNRN